METKNFIKSLKITQKYFIILLTLSITILIINIFSDDTELKLKLMKLFSEPGNTITLIALAKTFYLVLIFNTYYWDDLKNRYEIIFSRINKKKWYIQKIKIIILFTLIIELIFLITMILFTDKSQICNLVIMHLKNYIFDLIIIFISIIIENSIKIRTIKILLYLIITLVIYKIFKIYFILIIPIIILTEYYLFKRYKAK